MTVDDVLELLAQGQPVFESDLTAMTGPAETAVLLDEIREMPPRAHFTYPSVAKPPRGRLLVPLLRLTDVAPGPWRDALDAGVKATALYRVAEELRREPQAT